MFAYCLNNPINRIDASGDVSIWYYLIVDHDMGFIHRLVQAHIALNYGVETEVTLSAYGRADIFHLGKVWEIKHAGQNSVIRIALAMAQAYNYVCLNDEVTGLGAAGAYSGEFYVQCLESAYLVEYTTPREGVILYSVTEVSNYNGEYYAVYVPKEVKEKQRLNNASPAYILLGCAFVGGPIPNCLAVRSSSFGDFYYAFE